VSRSQQTAGPRACTFRVVSNEPLCRDHLRLKLSIADFPPAAPGQFIHIGPPAAPGEDAGAGQGCCGSATGDIAPFLRRAFSIGGMCEAGGEQVLEVIYRVVGAGTRWMAGLRPGDRVDGIGPLGGRFPFPPPGGQAWLVAGGVGLPPLQWFARLLHRSGWAPVVFVGARSRELLPLRLDETGGQVRAEALPGIEVVVATDDGSMGHHGSVVEAVQAHADRQCLSQSDLTVYTCGPEGMIRATARFCAGWGVRCFVCLERAMACGIGTCQSCAVPVRHAEDEDGWRYALCCTDGPVFDASEVCWDR